MSNLLVITVLALSFLSSSWTAQAVDKPTSESLSAKDRIEVFETICKTINDEYYNYNPAFAEWAAVRERYRHRVEATKNDDELYGLLNLMLLRELQDFHTTFAAPNEQSRSNGLSVNEVEGKVVVVRVGSAQTFTLAISKMARGLHRGIWARRLTPALKKPVPWFLPMGATYSSPAIASFRMPKFL